MKAGSDGSSSLSVWTGTTNRNTAFRKLYDHWSRWDRALREDVPLLTLLSGQNARAIREDILPQLQRALSLERIGVDPFSLWDDTPDDLAKKLSSNEPRRIQNAEFTEETKPLSKEIHLGRNTKTVPLRSDHPDEGIPEEPYEADKTGYSEEDRILAEQRERIRVAVGLK